MRRAVSDEKLLSDAKLIAKQRSRRNFNIRTKQALSTLMRVALPTLFATVLGFLYFDNLSLYIRSTLDVGTIRMLMADEAQFVQNFLTVIGLLFSILAGNAYSALYQQQEAIYFALFQEVSEAKSLLEQTTLVCQGRPFYQAALAYMRQYVKRDLRRLDIPPAQLLSTKPMDDPLENIMYITSVGVPSVIYETVKNLRQARAYRLGAMQRKFPFLGIALLYLLASVELLAFPLLGAGTATGAGILSLQSILFGCLAGAHMLVLRIIQELWQASGGVFNVDEVLQEMVFGLEEELELRSQGTVASSTRMPDPFQWSGLTAEDLQPPSHARYAAQAPTKKNAQELLSDALYRASTHDDDEELAEERANPEAEQASKLAAAAAAAETAIATAAAEQAEVEAAAADEADQVPNWRRRLRFSRAQRVLLGRTQLALLRAVGSIGTGRS